MDTPDKKSLIILNYHHVCDGTGAESLLSVLQQTLKEQLKIVRSSEIPLFSLNKVCQKIIPENFSIAITIDDGTISDYEMMLPLLQENSLPATFFPIISKVGTAGYMDWQQIRQLDQEGFGIGSHGISHDILTRKNAEQQKEELENSKKELEDRLGKEVCNFAFPYGRYDDALLLKAKEAGYKAVYSTGLKVNLIAENNFLLFRWNITNKTQPDMLQQVLNSKGIISNSFDMQNRIKAIAGRLKNT